jgi:hypothetical protein
MFDFESGHPVYILRFNAKVIALHLATLRKSLFSEHQNTTLEYLAVFDLSENI